jgi:hypothetical protein
MSFSLTFTSQVLRRCDLTSGSRRQSGEVYPNRRTPTINHARAPFIENKRCRKKPRQIGDVVNRKAVSVYQTDAVLILVGGVQGRRSVAPTTKQYRVR